MYKDTFEYSRRYYRLAWHDGSIDVSSDFLSLRGYRVNVKSKWFIVSAPHDKIDELTKYLNVYKSFASHGDVYEGEDVSFDIDRYVGVAIFGEIKEPYIDEVMRKMTFTSSLIKEKNVSGEAIMETYIDRRKIFTPEGEAVEEKVYTSLSVYIVNKYLGKKFVGSDSVFTLGGASRIENKEAETLVERAFQRAYWASNSKGLGSSDRGQKNLVLSQSAAAFLLHEISHAINNLYRDDFRPGRRVSSAELTLRDDPIRPDSPSIRMFDDECIKTLRKTIIEKGEIVEILGTTSTEEGSRPGNAYGLAYPPEPFHTNLLAEGGDWSDKEILEETKEGFFIDNALHSYVYDKVITIHPEASWRITKGEIIEPVWIREVKIPMTLALNSIDAVGRTLKSRCGWEKGWIVCEHSPFIRLKGYIY